MNYTLLFKVPVRPQFKKMIEMYRPGDKLILSIGKCPFSSAIYDSFCGNIIPKPQVKINDLTDILNVEMSEKISRHGNYHVGPKVFLDIDKRLSGLFDTLCVSHLMFSVKERGDIADCINEFIDKLDVRDEVTAEQLKKMYYRYRTKNS